MMPQPRQTLLLVNMVRNARESGYDLPLALADQAANLVRHSDEMVVQLKDKGQISEEDIQVFRNRLVEQLISFINQIPC